VPEWVRVNPNLELALNLRETVILLGSYLEITGHPILSNQSVDNIPSLHSSSPIRCLAILKYWRSFSIPTKFLLSLLHATPVVPSENYIHKPS